MTIEYEQFLGYPCDTGDPVHIKDGGAWECVVPCTVIGCTVKSRWPILDSPTGPKLNTDELVRAGSLRTGGRPGQVPIEVMTLGQWQSIHPKELQGKEIVGILFEREGFLAILCADKTYIKLKPWACYDEIALEDEHLTMRDLQILDLITDETSVAYQEQKRARSEGKQQRHGASLLQQAIGEIGLGEVRKLIDAKP
jgi:hypothetical protein